MTSLHDAARSIVADEPDEAGEPELQPAPCVSRTLTPTFTGPPEVHVRLGFPDGVRHRILIVRIASRTTGLTMIAAASRTVCGLTIVDHYYAHIDEEYEGVLCPECFRPSELRAAETWRAYEQQRLHAEQEQYDAERAEHSRQLEAGRVERQEDFRRRFPTGETQPVGKVADPDVDDDPGDP